MKRTWILALALAAAGCKAPAPSIDPFFGRSTVPPPALGAAAPPPADNAYYSGAPSTASPGPGGAAGTAAQPVARRQSDDSPERVEPRPATRSLRSANPDEAPPRGATQQTDPATSRHRLTGVPRGRAQAVKTDAEEPGRFVARGPLRGIDPPDDDDADSSVQQAGFVELPAPGGSSEVRRGGDRAYSAGSVRYDRAADYSWLSGRLEYSPTGDRWKLRYIPIDGATDDYGGSVIIAEEASVRDYRSGSFVTVYGKVEGRNADARAFAPSYRVESIESAE